MNLQPIFGGKNDLLGDDELRGRKVRGKLRTRNHLASGRGKPVGHGGGSRGRAETDNRAAIGEFGGRPFHRFALAKSFGFPAINTNAPQMAPVNIVLIRGVNDRAIVVRYGDVFHFEFARSEERRAAAASWNGIQMVPAVLLGSEDDSVSHEMERFVFRKVGKGTDKFLGAMPDGARISGSRIGNVNSPGIGPRLQQRQTLLKTVDAHERDLLAV